MDRGKVVSRGEGSGEGVRTKLMSDKLWGIRLSGEGSVTKRKHEPVVCVNEERGYGECHSDS